MLDVKHNIDSETIPNLSAYETLRYTVLVVIRNIDSESNSQQVKEQFCECKDTIIIWFCQVFLFFLLLSGTPPSDRPLTAIAKPSAGDTAQNRL